MSKSSLLAFNRGRISPLALARTDFARTQFSAEVQTNFVPRALGSMMLRPGLGYTGATRSNNYAMQVPFVKSTDDTARVEFSHGIMRVWVDDELVTRVYVTTAITNGGFDANVAGWSDQDAGSAVSAWVAATAPATGGYLSLIGDGNAAAKRRQQVTVLAGSIGLEHALDIHIERGPVYLRVGSTAGGDEYITESALETGYHSLAFTPTGDFHIDVYNYNEAASLLDSIQVAAAGTMEMISPYLEVDLINIRWDQSGDVIFLACDGYRQRRVERRSTTSWSLVEYKSNDGPFRIDNVGPITITPGALSGDTTLTASASLFRSGHVGALFRLTHTGQNETASLSGADQWCDPIRITGVDGTRTFAVQSTGVWVGTLTLQYSVAEPGSWVDAPDGSFTSNPSIGYDDTLDNQIIYYRFGFKAGDYTSGTAAVSLSTSSGSQTGIARITAYTNATTVSAGIIEDFGGVTATADWAEGTWSAYRGYPTAPALYEGRLWWVGQDRVWGSISDAYDSHDDTFEGDGGPISRSIGRGPVDNIHWALPLGRLLLGTEGSVWSARSTSLDEPLTPTNFNLKDISEQGAADCNAVKMDSSAIFVQRSRGRVYAASYDANTYDYSATDLTVLCPEIGDAGFTRLAIQRQPETRIHGVRADGTVGILIYDPAEDVKCWIDFETDGLVEDVLVLPGTFSTEDQVYYTVRRSINGSTGRYIEKWALENECIGGTLNKQADSFVIWSGSSNIIDGLGHLEGEEVVCWADGVDQGVFTVTGAEIDLGEVQANSAVVGLGYEALFKSTKLAYAVAGGSALTAPKRVSSVGIIAANIHAQGLQHGPDFDTLEDMPQVENGAIIDPDSVRESYDEPALSHPGGWDSDSRLCLKATAPRPCTILAAVMDIQTNQ